ncbi:hypothetical protein BDV29DRAFT_72833 [Aspergillus leporis]|uniref:Uncharacterized protein n=1 Tax=Aspergillus leporis TaxID=41062 RepID=A0A5N5WMI3_9EURO|nr:hypothetical protein BDV29DRAFT_72833 [Aspergillus leporis]
MSNEAPTKVSIILKSQDDWRAWYSLIQSQAKTRDVWDYINPNTSEDQLPGIPKDPVIPEILNDPTYYDLWKMRMQLYNAQKNQHDQIKQGIAAVHETIQSSVSTLLVHHLYKDSTYQILRLLKKQLEPTKQQAAQSIFARYKKTQDTPVSNTNLDQ